MGAPDTSPHMPFYHSKDSNTDIMGVPSTVDATHCNSNNAKASAPGHHWTSKLRL